MNVAVTPEQHALLLELASLQGGSAAGFLRRLLDDVTPLLRTAVPALRGPAEETNSIRTKMEAALAGMRTAAHEQADETALYDLFDRASRAPDPPAAKRGRTGRTHPADRKTGK